MYKISLEKRCPHRVVTLLYSPADEEVQKTESMGISDRLYSCLMVLRHLPRSDCWFDSRMLRAAMRRKSWSWANIGQRKSNADACDGLALRIVNDRGRVGLDEELPLQIDAKVDLLDA